MTKKQYKITMEIWVKSDLMPDDTRDQFMHYVGKVDRDDHIKITYLRKLAIEEIR